MTVRTFAFAAGILYLALGVLGLGPPLLAWISNDGAALQTAAFDRNLLGVLAISFFSSLVHTATGAWGIAASRGTGGSLAYAKTVAVIYAGLAVMGLIPALNTLYGFMPLHGSNVLLHGATAVAAAIFGWVFGRRAIFSGKAPAAH